MKPIKGHALQREGGPFDENGRFIGEKFFYTTRGGRGRAKCECGALSEELSSSKPRQRWHRQHKEAVLAQTIAQD